MTEKNSRSFHKNHLLILFIFFVGAFPNASFGNKYLATLIPMLVTVSIILLSIKDLKAYDLNLLKSSTLYGWVGRGITYCVVTQALFTLLFGFEMTSAELASVQYVIMPVYIVTGALIEEVVFRKILLSMMSKLPFWTSSLISSSIYAAYHFNLTRFISFLVVGMIFCFLYKKSNTLAVPIITHIFINIIGLVSLTIRS
ncbi:hypothetical protein SAMN02799630_00772 [Paenibacillus sp. UNCCL117]|uniref:CPBP family intramembrane glutamic endopeptidase n=1 Tax=unclassified Paenibacillus TaxID=185978 RepID=UPI000886742E|nr:MULTISPECIES: CPBP family intramembrane glutamic endopeptidase [unclassified Paenibacillus]SDC19699.1 hypothetical protein SAMN04488602_101572 [Paenibacillus sp. cl123]SFW18463.1 hypothetical protein SAMN02799630_00772 [Paenibacillus sp. UNCCL117]